MIKILLAAVVAVSRIGASTQLEPDSLWAVSSGGTLSVCENPSSLTSLDTCFSGVPATGSNSFSSVTTNGKNVYHYMTLTTEVQLSAVQSLVWAMTASHWDLLIYQSLIPRLWLQALITFISGTTLLTIQLISIVVHWMQVAGAVYSLTMLGIDLSIV